MKFLFVLIPFALSAGTVDFEKQILPVLKSNCIACHGQTKPKAGLNLETPETILKGGDSGPSVVPKDPDKSLLYISAAHKDPELIMPPKENKVAAVALNTHQLNLLHQWISQGATGQVSSAAPVAWQPIPNALNAVYSVALTSDGQYAAAGRANRLYLYRLPLNSEEQLSDAAITNSNPGAAHLDTVNSLAFSPDGNLLASGGYREIKLWRKKGPSSQKLLNIPNVETFAISSNRVAVATNGVVSLWIDGNYNKLFTATAEPIRTLAFSPNADKIAASYSNGFIRIWNVHDGSRVSKFTAPANSISWTDEAHLAIGESNIRVLNITNQSLLHELKVKGPVISLQATGNILQTALSDGTVQQWDAAKNKLISEIKLKKPLDEVSSAERALTVANQDLNYFKARLTTAETNNTTALARHKKAGEANSAAQKLFSDKQAALTNAVAAKTNAIVALAKLKEESRKIVEDFFRLASTNDKDFNKAKTAFENLSKQGVEKSKPLMDEIAANPKKVAAAEKELKNADLEKNNAETEFQLAESGLKQTTELLGKAKADLTRAETNLAAVQKSTDATKAKASSNHFRAFAFSPQKIAALDSLGNAITWNTNGALLDTIPGTAGLAFAGDRLVSTSTNGIESWSLRSTWQVEKVLGSSSLTSPISDRVNTLAFTADGQQLISGGGEPSRGGEILIWQVADGKLLRNLNHVHSDSVLSLNLSPDCQHLASGAADRFAKVTDLKTGKVIRTFEGHTHHVLGVSWKADGRSLLTSGADNVLKLWDFTTGDRRRNIEGFSKELTAVAFLGAGDTAVTATENSVLLVNEKGERPRYFHGASEYIYSIATSASGDLIVGGNLRGAVYVWKSEDSNLLTAFYPK